MRKIVKIQSRNFEREERPEIQLSIRTSGIPDEETTEMMEKIHIMLGQQNRLRERRGGLRFAYEILLIR